MPSRRRLATDDDVYELVLDVVVTSEFRGIAVENTTDGVKVLVTENATVVFGQGDVLLDAFPTSQDPVVQAFFDAMEPPSFDDMDFILDFVQGLEPGASAPADFLPTVPDVREVLSPFWEEKFDVARRRRLLQEARRLGTGVTYSNGIIWITGGAEFPSTNTTLRTDDGTTITFGDAARGRRAQLPERGASRVVVSDYVLGTIAVGDPPSGWHYEVICENENSLAQFVRSNDGTARVLRFQATDVTSFSDWYDNLNAFSTTVDGFKVHQGAYEYMSRVEGCINAALNAGYSVDYIVGHSLGGASGVLYALFNGQPAPYRSYGAYATRHTDQSPCSVAGVRYIHEDDPVGSDALGLFSSYNHDVSSAVRFYTKETTICTNEVWGICYWWSTTYEDTNAAASCTYKSNLYDIFSAAYYFAAIHSSAYETQAFYS